MSNRAPKVYLVLPYSIESLATKPLKVWSNVTSMFVPPRMQLSEYALTITEAMVTLRALNLLGGRGEIVTLDQVRNFYG